MLMHSFCTCISQKRKRQSSHQCLFALLGFEHAKAALKRWWNRPPEEDSFKNTDPFQQKSHFEKQHIACFLKNYRNLAAVFSSLPRTRGWFVFEVWKKSVAKNNNARTNVFRSQFCIECMKAESKVTLKPELFFILSLCIEDKTTNC